MERKLISFSREVYERLVQEPRGTQSALIDALLATHYDIQLTGDNRHALIRSQIQATLRQNPEFTPVAQDVLENIAEDGLPHDVLADDPYPADEVQIENDETVPTTDPADIPLLVDTIKADPGPDITINVLGQPTGVPPVAPMDHNICPKCGNIQLLPNCLNCDY